MPRISAGLRASPWKVPVTRREVQGGQPCIGPSAARPGLSCGQVSTRKLGMPAELRRLEYSLPVTGGPPVVRITPPGRRERKGAAYEADHYEVPA
jgi:hypothetical protein